MLKQRARWATNQVETDKPQHYLEHVGARHSPARSVPIRSHRRTHQELRPHRQRPRHGLGAPGQVRDAVRWLLLVPGSPPSNPDPIFR